MILLGLGLAVGLVAQAQNPSLTVDEAVAIATAQAFDVRLAKSELEKVRQQTRQALGNLGPAVTLEATYSKSEFDGGQSQDQGGPPSESKQVGARLTQVVDIVGATGRAANATKLQERAAQAGLEARINLVKQGVRNGFYAVLSARSRVDVARDSLTSSKERLAKGQVRFDQGAVARFDVLRLEAEVKRAEQDLLAAERNYELSKQSLNSSLGRAIETPFDPVQPEGVPMAAIEAGALVAQALSARPEIRQADFSIRSLEEVRRANEIGNLPTLRFNASHFITVDPGPFQSDAQTTTSLVMAWPVFDSGITRAKVKAARQDEEQAKIRREQLALAIALEVRSAVTRVETARKALDSARAGEAVAKEAMRLAQLRFDEGAGILLDVIAAQAEYTRAQAATIDATAENWAAFAALQRAVGTDNFQIPGTETR